MTSAATSSSAAVDPDADPNPIIAFLSNSTSDDSTSLSISLGVDSNDTTAIPSNISSSAGPAITASTASGNKQVFAHFMVGIVSTYVQSDWVADMTLAKSKGITGFALNIGVDSYSQAQLDLAYSAAQVVGFNVFISFDFNWWAVSDVSGVATMLSRYASLPAQLLVDGRPFVSSFIGDGFDWAAAASQVGRELYAVPYWAPTLENANNPGLSGLFSW